MTEYPTQDMAARMIEAAMAHYAWRELTEPQAETMRQLIGSGVGAPLPSDEQHCNVTVELRRLLAGESRYYITANGRVFVGDTLAKSRRIGL